MKDGIYEEIINNKLSKELNEEDFFIGKEKLDDESAKIILTQYIGQVTKDALKYLRDDVEANEYLVKQIEICNDIIELLKNKLNYNEFEKLKINENAEVLTYAYSKVNFPNLNGEVVYTIVYIYFGIAILCALGGLLFLFIGQSIDHLKFKMSYKLIPSILIIIAVFLTQVFPHIENILTKIKI